jgi:predicted DCC family thiol-disulfide oxidoreductase YuxK
MGEPRARPVLLYDGACRFCRFAARAIVRLDRGERLALLPFDDKAAGTLLERVPEGERTRSIHLVDSGGSARSGGDALAAMIDRLGLLPHRVSGLVARLYKPVARRRSELGPRVPDGEAPRRYP